MNSYLITFKLGHGTLEVCEGEGISAQAAVDEVRAGAPWPIEISRCTPAN